eukprot:TRINITY_DN18093_c0_g1_i1.p1 TRINITY_DN18093_c0_g1~~TRINITY_DN18093_c0_g1_i1.p1  ORF type:complete len:301 (+),score=60.08 TRINITY_DN18093_c0_g1_i1:36-905(+)
MAESTLAAECPVCLAFFEEGARAPMLLACGHTFCCGCLDKLARGSATRVLVACPLCAQRTDLPEGDAASLKKNFSLITLLGALRGRKHSRVCEECGERPAGWSCDACGADLCADCDARVHGQSKVLGRHSRSRVAESRPALPTKKELADPKISVHASVSVAAKEVLLFGPGAGEVLSCSSAEPSSRGPENLRTGENDGWVADTYHDASVELAFNLCTISRINLWNYASDRYRILTREGDGPWSEYQPWTNIVNNSEWQLTKSMHASALRLELDRGNKTSFYLVNVWGHA